jgi:hypothetical protein
MRIAKLDLKSIKPNPNNPRIIKNEQYKRLVKSLREFPEMLELREIVVDENMMVLGSNMRLRALQEIGEKEAIVKIAEGLTEDQKKEFIIKDNSAFGSWNYEELANAWSDLPLVDWGIECLECQDLIDYEQEWQGMPEYKSEAQVYRSMIVHFATETDFRKFMVLMEQDVTDKTKFIWYPNKERRNLKDIAYTEENES